MGFDPWPIDSLGVPSISILSRDPSFWKTSENPGKVAFEKNNGLKRMCNQPLEVWKLREGMLAQDAEFSPKMIWHQREAAQF